jgi:hypothetical protein
MHENDIFVSVVPRGWSAVEPTLDAGAAGGRHLPHETPPAQPIASSRGPPNQAVCCAESVSESSMLPVLWNANVGTAVVSGAPCGHCSMPLSCTKHSVKGTAVLTINAYTLLCEEQACWWTGSLDTVIGCSVGKICSSRGDAGTS